MSFCPMAHHTVTFSWLRGRRVCSWGWAWAQKRIFYLLICPLMWQGTSSLKKIKCNKPGLFLSLLLISLQNVSCSALLWSVCKERPKGHHAESLKMMFSKSQFLVRNGVLIFQSIPQGVHANSEYSQELWLNNVDHCGLCGHLPHFLSPEIWPLNVELPFYQVHCAC